MPNPFKTAFCQDMNNKRPIGHTAIQYLFLIVHKFNQNYHYTRIFFKDNQEKFIIPYMKGDEAHLFSE